MEVRHDVLLALAFGIICAAITAMIAKRKGRSTVGWFVLGFLFPPFAILVVAAISPTQISGNSIGRL